MNDFYYLEEMKEERKELKRIRQRKTEDNVGGGRRETE